VKPFMKLAIPSAFMIWYKQIFQIIIMWTHHSSDDIYKQKMSLLLVKVGWG
jgi:hypothetical protein